MRMGNNWCGSRQPNTEVVTRTHTQEATSAATNNSAEQQGDTQAASDVSSLQAPLSQNDSSQLLSPIDAKDLDHTTPPTWSPSAGWESGKKDAAACCEQATEKQSSLPPDQGLPLTVLVSMNAAPREEIHVFEKQLVHASIQQQLLDHCRGRIKSVTFGGESISEEETFEDRGAATGSFFTARSMVLSLPVSPAKVLILGDGAVGKTCLLESIFVDNPNYDYGPTTFYNYDVSFEVKEEPEVEEGEGKLEVWDSGGGEAFQQLNRLALPGTQIVILAYSSLNSDAYGITHKWMPMVQETMEEAGEQGKYMIVLVATKQDLQDGTFHGETRERGLQMAREIGASAFVETSAKYRTGLDLLLALMVELVCVQARGDPPMTDVLTEPRYITPGSVIHRLRNPRGLG